MGARSVRYTSGHPELGQSPEGFDCSGFVRYVLLQSGFDVEEFQGKDHKLRPIRHTNEFLDHYGILTFSPEPGDLILMTRQGISPTHIGIVIDEERYIHAPGTTDTRVAISAVKRTIIKRRDYGKPFPYPFSPIAFKAPTLLQQNSSDRFQQDIL